MSDSREQLADQTAKEILEYVFAEYLPKAPEGVWEAIGEADRALVVALGTFERGELSYDELEAVGVEYVEAWGRAVGRSESDTEKM